MAFVSGFQVVEWVPSQEMLTPKGLTATFLGLRIVRVVTNACWSKDYSEVVLTVQSEKNVNVCRRVWIEQYHCHASLPYVTDVDHPTKLLIDDQLINIYSSLENQSFAAA